MNNCNYGFIVVRLPEYVGNIVGDMPNVITSLVNTEISYFGVDRDPWWDFGDLFYSKVLTEKHVAIHENILKSKFDSFSPGVCYEIDIAKEVLSLSNKGIIRNELVLISNTRVNIEEQSGFLEQLGFDCYIDGYGSLLRLGIFRDSSVFNDFVPYLNKSGLFDSVDQTLKYIKAYIQRCRQHNMEPIETKPSDIDIYSVYKVV